MNKGKLIPWLAAGLMTLVLAVGAVGYQSVYAQAATPEASTTETVPAKPLDARGPRGLRGGPSAQDLADALGIDLATLQAAEQTAKDNALAQAVAQGLITQEQADQLTADGAGLRHMRGINLSTIDMHALLADALGITTDELSAARQTAANAAIDRAVEAGTLTQEQADLMKGRNGLYADEQFQSSMTSAFEEAVQQAVTSGVISQAQADQILAQSNGKGLFGRGGFRLPGMGGGHRGPRGGFNNGTTTPTITGDNL